ncbi:MAG: phage integrase N-terminal SAM-like domain-containing protein [Chroococcidiopsidaceae cyanobacterium CP_BM_RX_35]|nr:phage integrase N-terminal SAM-like domain-containing protein [Chroococcidiopsidaceae cyanobacterium CP_BM_RX_35]
MLKSDSLPPISLIDLTQSQQLKLTSATPPSDLRSLRVEEFLKARSLSANSQKAYRRELTRFLQWTDRPLADITPRQVEERGADNYSI